MQRVIAEPFSVCFNIMKMKYKDYDESLTSKDFLVPNDKINVFINLEAIFKNLSMINELENKIILQRDFQTILVSNTLNLIGHYKRFFVNNGLDTRVYLYYTDLESDEFSQYRYNDDYRSYYIVKYNNNPKFGVLTDALKSDILPEIKTYCEFIPNVYHIAAKNLEGSLVPYIIAKEEPERKNLILSGDMYDSQYALLPGFVAHIFQRIYGVNSIASEINGFLKRFVKKKDPVIENSSIELFRKYPMYCALLATCGSKDRSIDGISGVKFLTLQKMIEEGIGKNILQETTQNPNLMKEIFQDPEDQKEFVNNYHCTSIPFMYEELRDIDIQSILYQKKDRIDIDSLKALNITKFVNCPLILEALL